MKRHVLVGTIVEDDGHVSLAQVCRACGVGEEWVAEVVAEGVVEPAGGAGAAWRFDHGALRRLRVASRLHRDLGVNAAGVALALELMDEVEALRARLQHLSRDSF